LAAGYCAKNRLSTRAIRLQLSRRRLIAAWPWSICTRSQAATQRAKCVRLCKTMYTRTVGAAARIAADPDVFNALVGAAVRPTAESFPGKGEQTRAVSLGLSCRRGDHLNGAQMDRWRRGLNRCRSRTSQVQRMCAGMRVFGELTLAHVPLHLPHLDGPSS
jgi:hypothetical protein